MGVYFNIVFVWLNKIYEGTRQNNKEFVDNLLDKHLRIRMI